MDFTVLNRFIEKLDKKQFPKISIALAYTAAETLSTGKMGIHIVDPITKDVLYTFLFSTEEPPKSRGEAEYPAAPVAGGAKPAFTTAMFNYLVTEPETGHFDLQLIQKLDPPMELYGKKIALSNLPPAYALSNACRADVVHNPDKSLSRPVKNFRRNCYLMAGIVLVLAVLHYLGVLVLSTTQYTMLGVTLALVILPDAKSMKFLGMEYETLMADETDTGKTSEDKPALDKDNLYNLIASRAIVKNAEQILAATREIKPQTTDRDKSPEN